MNEAFKTAETTDVNVDEMGSRVLSPKIWRTAMDHLPAGVFLLDRAGAIVYWNGWLAENTGIPPDAAAGQTLSTLFPGFNNPRFKSALEATFGGGTPEDPAISVSGVLIPIPVRSHYGVELPHMQQRVRLSALPVDPPLVMVAVIDVTQDRARSRALLSQVQSLREKSNRDPLTGLYNYGFMIDWLDQQIKMANRRSDSLACLMIDIDDFKLVNDAHGHPGGDLVIQGLVAIINSRVRASDVVSRYGGDEFTVLMPGCGLEGAMKSAEGILEAVRRSAVGPMAPGALTCSIGLAAMSPGDPCTALELLERADKHLYQAKDSGGNTLVPNART